MTLRQAIRDRVSIKPGHKVVSCGGWIRQDRVLVDGREIGSIRTRRGRGHLEVVTIAGNTYMSGYNVDWLVGRR